MVTDKFQAKLQARESKTIKGLCLENEIAMEGKDSNAASQFFAAAGGEKFSAGKLLQKCYKERNGTGDRRKKISE